MTVRCACIKQLLLTARLCCVRHPASQIINLCARQQMRYHCLHLPGRKQPARITPARRLTSLLLAKRKGV